MTIAIMFYITWGLAVVFCVVVSLCHVGKLLTERKIMRAIMKEPDAVKQVVLVSTIFGRKGITRLEEEIIRKKEEKPK